MTTKILQVEEHIITIIKENDNFIYHIIIYTWKLSKHEVFKFFRKHMFHPWDELIYENKK